MGKCKARIEARVTLALVEKTLVDELLLFWTNR